MSPELQIIFVFGVFLVLLAAGMAVPFAIVVPAMLYLLLQGGVAALKGLGLVSWGSMDSFTLTAIPLFILMAEILQASGLSCAHLSRPRQARRRGAGRAVADQHRRLRGLRRDQRVERRHRCLDRRGGAAATRRAQL